MNKKISNKKGIALISLTIAVTIILIITGTIIYNLKDNLQIEKLEQMESDIENLQDKIVTYYAQYGIIPAKFEAEYTSIEEIKNANLISEAVDTGKFYVIDLQAIENLTLNFGQDYENIKNLADVAEVNNYKNLYIINEDSHNIFFPQGIEVDGENFYTNYRKENVDKDPVKLRYFDGVKIPEGYNYLNGNKETQIIIENKETQEQYKWIVLETDINELPEGVTVEEETEFLKSANHYNGYYQSLDDETKVITTNIEEKWSPVYDTNGVYKDKNEDTAIIPAGFKVSRTLGMKEINDGLVIQDENKNEFVWVPVDKNKFNKEFIRRAGYKDQSLQDISSYAEANGEGFNSKITESEETQLEAKKMYASVKANGGFYIGRYETGKDEEGNAVTKKEADVYNNIGWNNDTTNNDITLETGGVVELARNFDTEKGYNTEKLESTLCYGVQWDTALNFIDPGYNEFVKDSSGMGWYSDNYNNTANGNIETNSNHTTGKDLIYTSTPTIISNMHKNIYDMGGNVWEYTMESYSSTIRVARGGCYNNLGNDYPASYRFNLHSSNFGTSIGFRIALYINDNVNEKDLPETPEIDHTVVLDTSGANHPDLKTGMTAITFNENGSVNTVTDSSKRDWYSYEVTTDDDMTDGGTTKGGNSRWANAVTVDDKDNITGYYVWIPRYAYKIYDDANEEGYAQYTSQTGNSYRIDVKFIGTEVTQENISTKLGANYADYIVHPAFTFGTIGETTTPNELSGIWVGKYETSGTATNPTILPNQVAATKSTISDLTVAKMFDMSKNVLTSDTQKAELDAHMMKNTEWGAVAYLAQSQYGRNGTEISVNQSSQKITGAGKAEGTNLIYESSSYSTAPTADQQYNGKTGKLSSTTGNIYGVYDMSGGTYEYVMGFYGTAENTPTLGGTGFTTETLPERKYYDLYINKTSADSSNIGDALYETKGWNGDSAYFVISYNPVFVRGGDYDNTFNTVVNTGAFYFSRNTGNANSGSGLRVCIAVK